MRSSWDNKQPRAYWKGNPDVVSPIRLELMKCNHSRFWGAQIMRQVRFTYRPFQVTPNASDADVCVFFIYRTGRKKQKVGLNNPSSPTNAITGKSQVNIIYVWTGGYEEDLIWFGFIVLQGTKYMQRVTRGQFLLSISYHVVP